METERALWKPLATPGEADQVSQLRAVPLFRDLSDAELKRLRSMLHERTYQPGELVFREGQTGAGMYLIAQGAVDVVMRMQDGSEALLVTLRDGQFFGELALLEEAPRSASCIVRAPTTLLGLFQPDLELLVERSSRLGAKVLWNLARMTGQRLREVSNSMRTGASGPA
jgi:CRP/FNR family transcriptional regulator, cyclic AMP receptor protein